MNRIVPGILLASFWLLLLLKGSVLLFSIVALIIVVIAADEYLRMASPLKMPLADRCYLVGIMSCPVLAVAGAAGTQYLLPTLVAAFFLLTAYLLYRYATLKDSYLLFSRLVFGVVYVGFLASHLVLLRGLPDGHIWLLIASLITASSDSGAYFVGCAIGKHKLCPNISPNKTIEGAVGGLVFGVTAAFVGAYLLLPGVNFLFLGAVAVLLTLAGVVGDLTESIIKRGTGTKDSGTCLSGHGGILDRIDSLLFAAPVLYTILVFAP